MAMIQSSIPEFMGTILNPDNNYFTPYITYMVMNNKNTGKNNP